MRKSLKDLNSEILNQQLEYKEGNSSNNKKIATLLLKEQKYFCAYTDEYISRTDSADIEHFNPTLKSTLNDGYNNWFIVKPQWNKEKSNKWAKFQPVLHPTTDHFEERIIYLSGDYIASNDQDIEAINLISLIKLDDPALADKRKKYIKRKKEEIEIFGSNAFDFFFTLIHEDRSSVSYTRAIQEEFGVDVWNHF